MYLSVDGLNENFLFFFFAAHVYIPRTGLVKMQSVVLAKVNEYKSPVF